MSTLPIKTWLNALAVISFLALMTYLLHEDQKVKTSHPPAIKGTKTFISQDELGNFITWGKIGDITSSMLIDTGASTLVLSEKLARKIGLSGKKRIKVATANGMTEGYLTVIKNIQIGNLKGENIEAIVVPNLGVPHVLVGMSFLETLNFEKKGSQLILQPGS